MRIRTIKPDFWKSQTINLLSSEAKLLALGLLNYADDEGYFFAHPALIRGELMPFAESHASVPGLLKELEEIQYIRLGEDAQKRKIGLVVHFKKHQRVDKPQRSKLAGTVEFPDWSPSIPGIPPESSTSTPEPFLAGMEGNGKGMEEEGKGAGKPSPDKPGGIVTSAESSIPEAPASDPQPDAATSKILLPAKKKKGGAAAEPEFPEDLSTPYRFALEQWWRYKRERHEGYKPTGWAALIKQQLKFPPEQVLASVEASMANNWAGLFTEKFGAAVDPSQPKWDEKKGRGAAAEAPIFEVDRSAQDVAPPDWRLIWGEMFSGACPELWLDVPDVNKRRLRAEIAAKKGKGAGTKA